MTGTGEYGHSPERDRPSWDAPVTGGPGTFVLRGRTWDLLPGVPAPPHSRSTDVAMRMLGFGDPLTAPRSGSFLEVGSGTGVIAVSAALAGCDRVVGTDTSPRAVRNTDLNAARHGVADRVRAVAPTSGSPPCTGTPPPYRGRPATARPPAGSPARGTPRTGAT